jgi:hypothetical protein
VSGELACLAGALLMLPALLNVIGSGRAYARATTVEGSSSSPSE